MTARVFTADKMVSESRAHARARATVLPDIIGAAVVVLSFYSLVSVLSFAAGIGG